MNFELSFGRDKNEPEQFEHRDTETLVEHAGRQRVGFDIPGMDNEED